MSVPGHLVFANLFLLNLSHNTLGISTREPNATRHTHNDMCSEMSNMVGDSNGEEQSNYEGTREGDVRTLLTIEMERNSLFDNFPENGHCALLCSHTSDFSDLDQ